MKVKLSLETTVGFTYGEDVMTNRGCQTVFPLELVKIVT